jgi:hypothetical protein
MTKKGGYRRVVAATVALVAVSACGCAGIENCYARAKRFTIRRVIAA